MYINSQTPPFSPHHCLSQRATWHVPPEQWNPVVHGPLTASSKPSSATSVFSVSSYTRTSVPNHSAQAADVTCGVALKVIPKEKVKGTRRACGAKCRSSKASIIATSYV